MRSYGILIMAGAYCFAVACASGTTGGEGGGGGGSGCDVELCDGFDNDCDGLVDEDCSCDDGDEQGCYSGSPATVDIGECSRGKQNCAGSSWGSCDGEVLPAAEACNGVDDNCDGQADEGCPCDASVPKKCYGGPPVTEGIGECQGGTQTCVNDEWGACEGQVLPSEEQCNGVDDDCDGLTDLDDGPASSLCAAVVHGSPDCVGGTCVIAGCDADYADVDADYTNGCECLANPSPTTSGDTCANAIALGTLSDVAADSVSVSGTAAPAGREIWWKFTGADDVDAAGDEYHVDVRFVTNPGTAYQMDVYRGDCQGSNRVATGEQDAFDWYTDFATTSTGCTQGSPCGEGDCVPAPAPPGVNSCGDDTAVFYVRVSRADGLPSCDGFTLELSNGKY